MSDYKTELSLSYQVLGFAWLSLAEYDLNMEREEAAAYINNITIKYSLNSRHFDSNWLRRYVYHPKQRELNSLKKRSNSFPLWLAKGFWIALTLDKWIPKTDSELLGFLGVFVRFYPENIIDYDFLIQKLPDYLKSNKHCVDYLEYVVKCEIELRTGL